MGTGRDCGVDPLLYLYPIILLIVAVMFVLGYHRVETLGPPFQ